jgi:hypothetical protein
MFEGDCEVALEIFYTTKYALIRKKSLFLSRCKINQNMEFGDIIYFILLVFFMILGFFNDSRKKKNKQKQQAEMESDPLLGEREEEILRRNPVPDQYKPKKPPLRLFLLRIPEKM